MAYRYSSRRTARRVARKSKRNFIISLLLIGFLLYATLNWILPYFIGGIGTIKSAVSPQKKITSSKNELTLAPPVLSIPFEATNSAQIRIRGYGVPDSQVKIFLDDEIKNTTKVSEDGSFTSDAITLNLGTNNIYAKTVDDNSRESLPSKTLKLLYLNDKPNLTVNQPEDGKKITGGDKKVTVSGKTDSGDKVFINDSQVIVDKDGNFSSDIAINDGDNTITIKSIDDASNLTEIDRRVTYSGS